MKTVQMLQSDLTSKLAALAWLLRKVGPYLAIEILMPGGTLIAIALFLYRRRNAAPDGTTLALRALATRAVEQVRGRLTATRERLRKLSAASRGRDAAPAGPLFAILSASALVRARASV